LPEDLKCSYGKGYELCRDNGLLCYRVRLAHGNTKRDPNAKPVDDLVQRDFQAENPGEKWFTDITEWHCIDGKGYLCGVLDGFDGTLVGYAIDSNMRTPLCTRALMNADQRFGHIEGCIVHGDHGSQFTSHLYTETIEAHAFRLSMGAVGHCADNARMESFWATLKKELIYKMPTTTMTRAEVRRRIFLWIETYYNHRRRNTANENNLPPLVKRGQFYSAQKVA
jgi:transposase InsO family protein